MKKSSRVRWGDDRCRAKGRENCTVSAPGAPEGARGLAEPATRAVEAECRRTLCKEPRNGQCLKAIGDGGGGTYYRHDPHPVRIPAIMKKLIENSRFQN